MSFTLPNPFKPSAPEASPQPARPHEFSVPAFDKRDGLSVLPYDNGIGKVARAALQHSGAAILREDFGIKDEIEARHRANNIGERLTDAGYYASRELYETDDIDAVWRERAVTGDDAMVTLLSLKHYADSNRHDFYANRAADVLQAVDPTSTRIELK